MHIFQIIHIFDTCILDYEVMWMSTKGKLGQAVPVNKNPENKKIYYFNNKNL